MNSRAKYSQLVRRAVAEYLRSVGRNSVFYTVSAMGVAVCTSCRRQFLIRDDGLAEYITRNGVPCVGAYSSLVHLDGIRCCGEKPLATGIIVISPSNGGSGAYVLVLLDRYKDVFFINDGNITPVDREELFEDINQLLDEPDYVY